ncbi:NADH-cytochrome b5 reductase 1 [Tetrabaena socialis]|uniref:NADH-cytochrome b5 reductase n=1 Tax=Tetrabaena socialis TaxID=47790 RepID=A0A2J8AH89_9CHLO|nr:NADH-cytochrome b5 reductase 1 [Tetrabaena socialis]|eukprot:PNH11879.1 NADH-cytochrome b5 reductase 1 [Tetrabaena socialis]
MTEIKKAVSGLKVALDAVRTNTDVSSTNIMRLNLKSARDQLARRVQEVSPTTEADPAIASATREARILLEEVDSSFFALQKVSHQVCSCAAPTVPFTRPMLTESPCPWEGRGRMRVEGVRDATRGSNLKANRLPKRPFLDPNEFQPLPLTEKTYITHNTLRLRFALPDPSQRLGLPIGQHITFLAKDEDDKDVYRPYTPVSDDDLLGCVDFVIKVYPQGKMSQVVAKMRVGDTMLMKGPKGRFTYTPNMVKHFGMVAGGTGITPMYQVLSAVLKNPADVTQLTLLFGNLTEEDILLRKELDSLVAMHGNRLRVHHVLNTPPAEWEGGVGFITKEMLAEHLPAPGPDVMVLRCGPNPMCVAMKEHLGGLGFSEEAQFQF